MVLYHDLKSYGHPLLAKYVSYNELFAINYGELLGVIEGNVESEFLIAVRSFFASQGSSALVCLLILFIIYFHFKIYLYLTGFINKIY